MKKMLSGMIYGLVAIILIAVIWAGKSSSDKMKQTASGVAPTEVTAGIKVPENFTATVVASSVGALRHLAVSNKGDVYVKLSKLKDGKGIYRLRDTNGDGSLDERVGFGHYTGTGVIIKNNYLYASSNSGVFRYKMNEKQEVMQPDAPEKLVYGLVATGRDESKSIAVDNKSNLYVSVGSYNDACRIPNTGKGMMPCTLLDSVGGVWQFSINKTNQTYGDGALYATGLKNAVGMDWNTKTNSLFVTVHGRGQFHDFYPQYYTPAQSAEIPAETLYELHKGADGGWPYIYYDQFQNKKILAPEYGGDGKKTGGKTALDPLVAFPAHLAPNDLLFYKGSMFPAKYRNGAFIAFHSQSVTLHKGYFIAFVPFRNNKPTGKWEIFADGFAGIDLNHPSGPIQHRPCGLAQGPDGSLYVADDLGGNVYRIAYKK